MHVFNHMKWDFLEFIQSISKDILQASNHIKTLIETLPGIDRSEEEQMKDIHRLEQENQTLAKSLMTAFEQTEVLRDDLLSELERVTTEQMGSCLK
jgi:hypothetical protein